MSVELGANKSDQLHAKEGTCFSHFHFTISKIRSNDKARKDTKTTRTDSQTAAVYYALGIQPHRIFGWLPVGTPHLIPFKDYKPWRKFESAIYPESSCHSSNFTAKISSSCLKHEALHLAFQVDQRKYQNLWILSLSLSWPLHTCHFALCEVLFGF